MVEVTLERCPSFPGPSALAAPTAETGTSAPVPLPLTNGIPNGIPNRITPQNQLTSTQF